MEDDEYTFKIKGTKNARRVEELLDLEGIEYEED